MKKLCVYQYICLERNQLNRDIFQCQYKDLVFHRVYPSSTKTQTSKIGHSRVMNVLFSPRFPFTKLDYSKEKAVLHPLKSKSSKIINIFRVSYHSLRKICPGKSESDILHRSIIKNFFYATLKGQYNQSMAEPINKNNSPREKSSVLQTVIFLT